MDGGGGLRSVPRCIQVAESRRSYLGEACLLEWGDGLISAAGLVRTVRAAQRDGLNLAMLTKLSESGGEGMDMRHCAKGLRDLLDGCGVAENITSLAGPIYTSCILPSTVIRLIAQSRENFQMKLAPSKQDCLEFWQNLFSSAEGMAYKNAHPVLRHRTARELSCMFPIRIHEDSGPYTKNASTNILSWSSLFARGSELETRFHSQMHVLFRPSACPLHSFDVKTNI